MNGKFERNKSFGEFLIKIRGIFVFDLKSEKLVTKLSKNPLKASILIKVWWEFFVFDFKSAKLWEKNQILRLIKKLLSDLKIY